MQDIAKKLASNKAQVAQNIASSVDLEKSNYAENDLNKMNSWDALDEDGIEKGHKDVSHLQMKIMTDKNGHQRKVYIRTHDDGKEHHFENGHEVEFEHKGQKLKGTIKSMKHHPKFDKFGTAEIADEHGNKYYKSLRNIDHSVSKESNNLDDKVRGQFAYEHENAAHEHKKDSKYAENEMEQRKHDEKEELHRKLSEYYKGERKSLSSQEHKEALKYLESRNDDIGDEYSESVKSAIHHHKNKLDNAIKASEDKEKKFGSKIDWSSDNNSKELARRYKEVSKDYEDDEDMTHGDIVRSMKESHGATKKEVESALEKHGVDKHSYMSPEDKEEMKIKSTKVKSKSETKKSKNDESSSHLGELGDNLKKSIDYTNLTIVELNELIKSEQVQAFTPQNIERYNTDLRKSFDDDEINRAEWEQGINEVQNLTKSIITNNEGNKYLVYLKLNDEINKSVEENGDLEKGMISDSLNNNDSFKFKKTGKELKSMLPVIIVNLTSKLNQIQDELEELEDKAGCEPTVVSTPIWNNPNIKCKNYPYNLIDRCKFGDDVECDSMRAYNDMNYQWASIKQDIMSCETPLINVEDNKTYDFTVSQLVALNSGDDFIIKSVNDTLSK